ncbi:MAG: helix-turn-helix transcriptional regulator [Clostridia bacterium]|nr:helix-turn-helix transcriptional regulator [Clostridia bacterium]
MAIEADLLRGYTDTILLSQLAKGDSYGYLINKRISESSGGSIEMKEATLYTAFRRLEKEGCIRSYWGDENTGARRRYYTLTEEGAQRLIQDRSTWRETRHILDKLIGDDADEE